MKKEVFLIGLYLLLQMTSCATAGKSEDGNIVTLDMAVREAAADIENRLMSGARVALLSFSSPSEKFSEYVLEELSVCLVNSGKLVIVDRKELDFIRQEERFQLSGEVSDESAQAIGKKLGAQYIVTGSLSSLGKRYRFRVKTLTVETATVAASAAKDISTGDEKVAFLLAGAKPPMEKEFVRADEPIPEAVRTVPDNFVRVVGGTFQMGTLSGGYDEERPVHTVTVKSFNIGKYEVTQKEWYEVMGTTVRQQRDMIDRSFYNYDEESNYGEGDNYPIYYVNWYEAVEYCNKRSLKEGLTPAYRGSGSNITCDWNANGYRLPTEAEWEFAARGGQKEYLKTEYSGSNNVDAVAWYDGNSRGSTQLVGTKAPNSLGIYDMSGNVWEWCWDWYGEYSRSSQTDPRGARSGPGRILRGGSWIHEAMDVRSVVRLSEDPLYRTITVGFRLVRP